MIFYYIVKSSSATVEGDFLFNGTIWFNSQRCSQIIHLNVIPFGNLENFRCRGIRQRKPAAFAGFVHLMNFSIHCFEYSNHGFSLHPPALAGSRDGACQQDFSFFIFSFFFLPGQGPLSIILHFLFSKNTQFPRSYASHLEKIMLLGVSTFIGFPFIISSFFS